MRPARSTSVVAGEFEYHNDPDKTEESRDPRGWSTLGDIGRLDEDGFLYLTDRKSYMIISGGVNIYPQEAENILSMHPKVHDVAVIGVPNQDFGEEVKAVVQPMDMADAGPDLERELIAYCREHLADVKCPRVGRLRRRAAPPPHRQALQAPAPRPVLGRPRRRIGSSGWWVVEWVRPAKPSSGQCHHSTAGSPTTQQSQNGRPLGATAPKSIKPRSTSRQHYIFGLQLFEQRGELVGRVLLPAVSIRRDFCAAWRHRRGSCRPTNRARSMISVIRGSAAFAVSTVHPPAFIDGQASSA